MRKFITLTDAYDEMPIYINVDHIEYVKQPAPDEDTLAPCYTEVNLKGKYFCVKESYEEVIGLLKGE